MQKLLTVAEVLDRIRISRPTLGRYVKLARQGESDFPLPVQTGAKTKRLWHPAALELWVEGRQSSPVANTTAISPKQQRRTEKTYQQRQEAAWQVLGRHGVSNTNNR